MVHDLCTVLGMDFLSTVTGVHPTLDDSVGDNCKSISDDTLSKLDKTVATLNEDKKLRLSKVKARRLVYKCELPLCLRAQSYHWFSYIHSFKNSLVSSMIFGISWMPPRKKGVCLIM